MIEGMLVDTKWFLDKDPFGNWLAMVKCINFLGFQSAITFSFSEDIILQIIMITLQIERFESMFDTLINFSQSNIFVYRLYALKITCERG